MRSLSFRIGVVCILLLLLMGGALAFLLHGFGIKVIERSRRDRLSSLAEIECRDIELHLLRLGHGLTAIAIEHEELVEANPGSREAAPGTASGSLSDDFAHVGVLRRGSEQIHPLKGDRTAVADWGEGAGVLLRQAVEHPRTVFMQTPPAGEGPPSVHISLYRPEREGGGGLVFLGEVPHVLFTSVLLSQGGQGQTSFDLIGPSGGILTRRGRSGAFLRLKSINPLTSQPASRTVFVEARIGGHAVAGGLSPVKGLDWRILASMPREDFRAPLNRLWWLLAGAMAVVAVLVLGLALYLHSRVAAPLAVMKQATEAMARGDLSRRVHVGGSSEIAALGQSFNNMATARAEAEETLRQSERRFRGYFEQSVVGIAITAPDTRLIEVNDRLCEILGYSRDELIETTWADLTPPEDLESELERYQSAKRLHQDRVTFEKRFLRKDGQIVHARVAIRCVRDERGEVEHYLSLLMDITDEYLNRAAMEEARRQQDALLHNIPDMAWFKDRTGRYIAVNDTFARLCGRSAGVLVGKRDEEVWPEEIARRRRADEEEVLRSGTTVRSEDRLPTADGRRIWVETIERPVVDTRQEIVGTVGIGRDITERKRAEAELAGHLRFLEILIDTIPSPVFYKDRDGVYRGVNNAFAEQIIGLPKERISGCTLFDLPEAIPKDLARRYHEADLKLLREGGVQFYEAQVQCKDGLRRDFAFYKATYTDTAGRVAGLVGVMLDVSERKEAGRAMAQRLAYETALADMSQALLEESERSLSGALQPILVATNANHVLLWQNRDDPDDGLIAVLTHEAVADGVQPWRDDTERNRLPYRGTFQRLQKPLERGEPLLIQADELPESERAELLRLGHRNLLALPILSAGELLGVLSIEHGEQKRNWSEPDLRLLQTMAERIGAYLGRERAEEALTRAERLAALGTFAGGVAHEFNNLNAGILGFAELVYYDELLHADLRPKIERILHAARRAGDITKGLLEFASPGEGRRIPRNLNQVVRQALSVFDPVLEEEPIEVDLKLGEIPEAPIDPGEISQAVLNVLLNAKHSLIERSEKRIHVETARERNRAVIRISDTGWGIPQANLRRIFTPFFSTKGEHARAGTPENRLRGVGLGLSVAHSILRHHEGGIQVESVEEKGSTFTLWIPLRDRSGSGEDGDAPETNDSAEA